MQRGTLKVTIDKATLQRIADAAVRVKIGTSEQKTRVKPNTKAPSWYETLSFPGTLNDFLKPMTITVLNEAKRSGGNADEVGQLTYNLNSVLSQRDTWSPPEPMPLNKGGAVGFKVVWGQQPNRSTGGMGMGAGHRRTASGSGGGAWRLLQHHEPPYARDQPPRPSRAGEGQAHGEAHSAPAC